MTEPESLLSRLRRLDREAQDDLDAEIELDALLPRHLPEIIEAFELLQNACDWVDEQGPWNDPGWVAQGTRLLSKVSGTDG